MLNHLLSYFHMKAQEKVQIRVIFISENLYVCLTPQKAPGSPGTQICMLVVGQEAVSVLWAARGEPSVPRRLPQPAPIVSPAFSNRLL